MNLMAKGVQGVLKNVIGTKQGDTSPKYDNFHKLEYSIQDEQEFLQKEKEYLVRRDLKSLKPELIRVN